MTLRDVPPGGVLTAPSMLELLSRSTHRGLWLWLMELYESNYLLLGTLCGSLKDLPEAWFSRRDGGILLILTARHLGPYTTEIGYRLSLPDTSVETRARLYHDARICEAVSGNVPARPPVNPAGTPASSFPRLHPGQPVEDKWALNLQFHRWLEYGLSGRHFSARALTPKTARNRRQEQSSGF